MKDGSGCGGMTGEKSWPVYVIVCIRYNICIYVYYNSTPRGKITIERRGEENKRRPWWYTVLLIISTSADEGIRKSTDERVHVYTCRMYIRRESDKGVGGSGGGGGVGGIKITVAEACRASD